MNIPKISLEFFDAYSGQAVASRDEKMYLVRPPYLVRLVLPLSPEEIGEVFYAQLQNGGIPEWRSGLTFLCWDSLFSFLRQEQQTTRVEAGEAPPRPEAVDELFEGFDSGAVKIMLNLIRTELIPQRAYEGALRLAKRIAKARVLRRDRSLKEAVHKAVAECEKLVYNPQPMEIVEIRSALSQVEYSLLPFTDFAEAGRLLALLVKQPKVQKDKALSEWVAELQSKLETYKRECGLTTA